MTGKHILFEIGTMVTGPHKDLAGYTNYEKFDDGDALAAHINDPSRHRKAGKRPTRLGKPGGHFDSPLDIVGEAGSNLYYFWLEPWSATTFAPGEPPILPIGEASIYLRDIKIWKIDNSKLVETAMVPADDQDNLLVSFTFDLDAAKNSETANKIRRSDHATAFKLPFMFNLVDQTVGAPPWAFDDHRYQPTQGISEHVNDHNHHDHDHDHGNEKSSGAGLKLFTHGGIHPDTAAKLFTHGGVNRDSPVNDRTHGGIHPPGVASFVIAEL